MANTNAAASKKTKSLQFQNNVRGYLFILPMVIPLLIFSYYPPINGIYRSFFDWNQFGDAAFVGFGNYIELFKDKVFLNSIPTMFYLAIPSLIIGITVPLIVAEMIFSLKSLKAKFVYRVCILLPMVAPGVVSTMLWKFIYDPAYGLMTEICRTLGIVEQGGTINWLGDPNLVIPSIIFMGFPWIGGTSVLIYMSGLMGISTEVIEASLLDGCSTFKRILKIDLPSLMGQVRYFLITGVIGALQNYGTQLILTKGGPGYTTYVPGYYMYMQAFSAQRMGYACAIGATLFVFIFALTLINYKFVGANKD